MYMILAANYPFFSENVTELEELIQNGMFNKKEKGYKRLSADAKSLLKSMLNVNVDEWISAEDALKHPWFSGKEEKENLTEATWEALINFRHFRAEAKL